MDRLKIQDKKMWEKEIAQIKNVLHLCRDHDIPLILHVLDKNNKTDMEIFKNLVNLIPQNIKEYSKKQVLILYDLLLKYNLGSQYLKEYYFYRYFEKNLFRFSNEEYIHIFHTLLGAAYFKDKVFWQDFILPFVINMQFTNKDELKKMRDCIDILKTGIPDIDIEVYMKYIIQYENKIIDAN